MRVIIAVIVLISCASCYGNPTKKKYTLPQYVKICHQTPDLNKCFKKTVAVVLSNVGGGIPEMLLPPLDPLHLPEISLQENAFKIIFSNIIIDGITKSTLDEVNVDLDKNEIFLKLLIPHMRIRSDYNVDGKLLILQLRGQGPVDGNYTNVVADAHITGKRIIKDNKEYFSYDKGKITLQIETSKLYFTGLFSDPEINETTNKLINENVKDILKELLPLIENTIAEFALQLAKGFFNVYSIDELFPL